MPKETAAYTFFPGCRFTHQQTLKRTRERTRDLLTSIGIALTSPPGSGCQCSGYPLLTLDRQAFAAHSSTLNLHTDRPIVSSCPLCCVALGAAQRQTAFHAVQLLADRIDRLNQLPLVSTPIGITYHDPCYLARGLGVIEEPRRILTSLPGVVLAEMSRNQENTFCCGMGGGVEHVFAEIVEPIARRRMMEAKHTGAGVCVTCCPPCLEALAPAGKEVGVEVVDIVDFIFARLNSG